MEGIIVYVFGEIFYVINVVDGDANCTGMIYVKYAHAARNGDQFFYG